jgi:hypothetical protein
MSEEPSVDWPVPPDEGHDSWMAGVGGGHVGRSSAFAALWLRLVLHDLMAPQGGYADGSQIEMGSVSLRVPVTERPVPLLDRLDLFRAVSMSPLDRWAPKVSWRFSLGADRERQGGDRDNRSVTFAAAGGPGLAVGSSRLRGFVFADVAFNAGAVYRHKVRLGAGGSLGFTSQPLPWWRMIGEASYLYPVAGNGYPSGVPGDDGADFSLHGEFSFVLHRNAELRIGVVRLRHVFEQTAGFRFYW